MATPGQLVEAMATALGIPLPTVTQYDRVLAEKGLRTTGGRGLSAAQVTAADAANLLLAIMGAPMSGAAIGDAALTCKRYGTLTLIDVQAGKALKFRSYWLRKIAILPAGHSLREAIVALIEGTMRDERGPVYESFPLRIRFDSPRPRARIFTTPEGRGEPVPIRTMTYDKASVLQKEDAVAIGDLRQSREVTSKTIEHIAATLKR